MSWIRFTGSKTGVSCNDSYTVVTVVNTAQYKLQLNAVELTPIQQAGYGSYRVDIYHTGALIPTDTLTSPNNYTNDIFYIE